MKPKTISHYSNIYLHSVFDYIPILSSSVVWFFPVPFPEIWREKKLLRIIVFRQNKIVKVKCFFMNIVSKTTIHTCTRALAFAFLFHTSTLCLTVIAIRFPILSTERLINSRTGACFTYKTFENVYQIGIRKVAFSLSLSNKFNYKRFQVENGKKSLKLLEENPQNNKQAKKSAN